MKKSSKRLLSILISMLFILQMFAGCAQKKTDDNVYLTNGEFFSYFVYENCMTSNKYTSDDINNCLDGSVERDILIEWEYLPEDYSTVSLGAYVRKETVVAVCANSTFELKQGDTSAMKDADMLDNPQLIANAYASGFFELENGYFDGTEKMTFADCEEILNKSKVYTANFHYPANTEEYTLSDDVFVDDGSDYIEGDIVVEFLTEVDDIESVSSIAGEKLSISTLKNTVAYTTQNNVAELAQSVIVNDQDAPNYCIRSLGDRNVKGFLAQISKDRFEKKLGNPKVGDTVVLSTFDGIISNDLSRKYCNANIIGVLKDRELIGGIYSCIFDYPDFEQAAGKIEDIHKNASGTGIDLGTHEEFVKEFGGWKLTFDWSNGKVGVTAEKDFTVYETGRKQDWQNAKKTTHAKAAFTISDFNIDVNNIKSFASKKGEGFIKITADTNTELQLSTSLRYTPDSNRNGKFPSNWSNSRWTDSDAKGAKSIKIAKFTPSLYGIVGAEINIYLLISFDGKISFATSIDDGGMEIATSNGKVSCKSLGTKTNTMSVQANVETRIGALSKLQLFSFIDIFTYDLGFNFDMEGKADLYYEDELSLSGVYADDEGLSEYLADDSKFTYCLNAQFEFYVSGEMKDCGVKVLLDQINKGGTLNFELPIWSACIHFENGAFVDECQRDKKDEEEIKKSENEDVELDVYKIHLIPGESQTVDLKAIPSETMDLLDSKNSITVKSLNNGVATVKYNKKSKQITIAAVGEGSTEIVVVAKKGILWWKETCEQKISVTVNAPANDV